MAELARVFQAAVSNGASDIHVTPGEPYVIRRFGQLIKVRSEPLSPQRCRDVVFELLSQPQRERLKRDQQLDFAIEVTGLGRFRGSVVMHRKGLGAVFRVIPNTMPTLKSLGLPEAVAKVLDNHQGLILVTGATGQGKSTTQAAMIDYINSARAHHVLTVEDPIEFVHSLKKGVVNQREIGTSTLSYANALRGALREDPDVIMVGEMRDLETMSLAISAAETGHLVIGTLATSSAPKTVDRVIDTFPASEQNQIRTMLSESLKAVITQRLLPSKDGNGMVLALEILIGTLPVANMIRDNKVFQLPSLMQTGKNLGMQLMDESLLAIVQQGKVSAKEAALYAANPKRFEPLQ